MSNSEILLQQAIQALQTGQCKSQNEAAELFQVKRSTLQNRLKGRLPRNIARRANQRFTLEQETFLVDWILENDAQGFPPTHARMREMAARVLRLQGDSTPLGKNWITRFLQRNPRVATCIGRSLDTARRQAATVDTINGFYAYFNQIQTQYGISPSDTWNMDEVGIGLGICANSTVIADSQKSTAFIESPIDREWVTIVETVSGTGRYIRATVIQKGATLQSSWFPEQPPDLHYTVSPNAWTSNELALRWLRLVFLPETITTGNYRMLLMDGHGSHATVDFLYECKQNNVIVVFLPAHTSHILQPLDLACFSPVKRLYKDLLRQAAYIDESIPIKRRKFIVLYAQARQERLTERTIRSGWKAAGLIPFDTSKGLHNRFVIQPPQTPRQPSQTTPPDASNQSLSVLQVTPCKPKQVFTALRVLSRNTRVAKPTATLLGKAAKAIGTLQARQASSDLQIASLTVQLEAARAPKRKRKVAVDLNKRFAQIDDIKAAQDAVLAAEANYQKKHPISEAQTTSETLQSATFESFCIQFQI
jgi:DDE superfamily endonuclease/Tc5 transposase DNA-binding domain/helix-turn-helix, Psq domain